MGDLPTKLAKEVRSYFGYAIDPKHQVKTTKSQPFLPLLSAASVLHPEKRFILPEDIVTAGKSEIARWISKLPLSEDTIIPPAVPQKYARLAAQMSSAAPVQSFNRFDLPFI